MATWLVTGANRGLGLEFARQLRARGDEVLATARKPDRAEELRATGAAVLPLEVSDPDSIGALAKALSGRAIDVLVNNAAVTDEDRKIGDLSMDAFRRVFDVNVFGTALVAQALLPNLRAGKRRLIANISSQLGSVANASSGFSYAYCASKAALNMATVKMAKDLEAERFTVVTLCPGWNRTDMGGAEAPLDPKDSIRDLIRLIDGFTVKDSGRYVQHNGKALPW
ncbi:MAG: SDR family oxidoreductase [Phycisphaerales bacterium]|nr:SDR family oxidoreductase [Phycisphaerales bacterium]